MRRLLACVAALVLLAGTASALSVGPGGYVYYGTYTSASSLWTGVQLYRVTLNSNWDNTTKVVNFDCITMLAKGSTAYSNPVAGIEVWDPRAGGGQGNLAVIATETGLSSTAGIERYPYDVVKVDVSNPANNKTFSVANGNILVYASYGYKSGDPNGPTGKMQQVVRVSTNWGGVTNNGMGVVTSGVGGVTYHYDANNNHMMDNSTITPAESGAINGGIGSLADVEYGPDGAVYGGYSPQANGKGVLYRVTTNSSAALSYTAFETMGGAGNPMAKTMNGTSDYGIAVGGTANKAIVYGAAYDNASGVYTASIFALVDGDGDGKADWTNSNDTVKQIFKSGVTIPGLTTGDIFDMEYYKDDNGTKWLLLSAGATQTSLYALQLADDGLAVAGGKLVGNNLASKYFEFDANPSVPSSVPEPTTLALLGTGALGALGWMRRRRLK